MKQVQRTLLALLTGLLVATGAWARTPDAAADTATDTATVVTFRFLPGEDLFILRGNETELERLSSLVDKYRDEITARRMPLYVDGYCASLPTAKENLNMAFVRVNRVKSELITRKGLTEADFITGNYATAYGNRKDVVVVTLRLPAKEEPKQPQPMKEQPKPEAAKREEPKVVEENQPQPVIEKEPQPEPQSVVKPESMQGDMPYRLALRTNLLYDALLLPTLGIEWRISPDLGIRLDGSLSRWGGSTGKVQKVWLLSPEVRWYLLRDRRFYVGAAGNYGQYNIYKYPLGNLLKDDTGYQGSLWSAGLSVGYQLHLARHLSVDFNLGLGYTRSEYDSFTVTDGVRVYKSRNRTKNLWGPTQAGISLVWTIGGNNK